MIMSKTQRFKILVVAEKEDIYPRKWSVLEKGSVIKKYF
jgi:hypothetical protein